MEPRNPEYAQQVEDIFRQAAFVMDVGYEPTSVTPGRVETRLVVRPRYLQAMAVAWEPEWAIATADGLWDQLSNGSRIGCFVGWMTYLARERGEVPALPAPVRVEPVGDKGTLVILTPERLTPGNPEHVALAWRVQKLLEERGLLRLVIEPRPSEPAPV